MTSKVSSGTLPFQLGKDKGQALWFVLGAEFRHLPRQQTSMGEEVSYSSEEGREAETRDEAAKASWVQGLAAAGSLASTSAAVHHVACISSQVLKVQ